MQTPRLAVIVPCFNEELCVEQTAKRLLEVLLMLINKGKIANDSYLYFIDDGSTDKTWDIIEYLHAQTPMVKGKKFIRNYGNQKAIVLFLLMRICSRMNLLLSDLLMNM